MISGVSTHCLPCLCEIRTQSLTIFCFSRSMNVREKEEEGEEKKSERNNIGNNSDNNNDDDDDDDVTMSIGVNLKEKRNASARSIISLSMNK